MPIPILLVEDDRELCALMIDFFTPHGYLIEAVHDGSRGLARAMKSSFDLIVLDVMMPVLDGFEVLRQIRKRSSVPVIMLTARAAEADRVNGLNAGADDYLSKPFGPEELLARIRAVSRRSGRSDAAAETLLEVGCLKVRSRSREVWLGSEPLTVTSTEFDILECLMRSSGRVVSRDALAAVLYQREPTPYERTIDVHISHLRKKLELENETLIHTVRGVGYTLAVRSRPAR